MFEKFSIQEVSRQIQAGEKSIEEITRHIPCHLHINSLEDFSVIETDPKLIEYFDIDIQELNKQGFVFLQKTVHPQDLVNAVNANLEYIENQDEMTHVSFFQRVTYPSHREKLYYTRGKVLDDKRILNLSVPVHDLELFNQSINDIYENVNFIKENLERFSLLTKKEIEVCRYLCGGGSLQDVADAMGVSIHTIKNHKINIYRKMNVHSFFRFYNFAVKFKIHK
ncbi:helix-turn-helix transcriptional regulator [Bernardetia sp.]|uniref:helix-turn-helix transcriptional regulator n=1 Tax=Bernardetia sp. TaxID=1937974 RepID=UPI0025B8E809|nr:helix-turn-helix transcriptional regulator [Bernardetia sp.]